MNAAPPPDPVSGGSLRLRLLAGTLAWMLLSIALAGWGLRALFQDHITQQLQAQLVMQLDHLSGAVDWGPDARVRLAPMAGDARLNQPLSGLYWQIDRLGPQPQAALARSRSLWDQTLALPLTEDATQGDQVLALRGAQGHELLAVARTLQLPDDDAPPLRLAVAADKALVAEPLQRFTRMLLLALGMLALGLALAVAVQLQLALRPLQQLRARLAAVRGGQTAQLEGRFPQELQPLVNEFNHVLAENADMVQRARTQAGNLAHAVHTPLSILANAAAQDNSSPLAQLVNEQVAIGKRLSDSTVGHIDGIRDSAQQVVTAVTDISAALNEQNATAHAIAQQVETVARLSETNSATARETESISANLDRLSSSLKTATGKFHV